MVNEPWLTIFVSSDVVRQGPSALPFSRARWRSWRWMLGRRAEGGPRVGRGWVLGHGKIMENLWISHICGGNLGGILKIYLNMIEYEYRNCKIQCTNTIANIQFPALELNMDQVVIGCWCQIFQNRPVLLGGSPLQILGPGDSWVSSMDKSTTWIYIRMDILYYIINPSYSAQSKTWWNFLGDQQATKISCNH